MRVRLKLDRLQQLIAQSNRSQNHWAIRIGISRGHWSAILSGRHPYPSGKTRERILEAFSVPFDEVFEVESGPSEGADATLQGSIADRYLIEKEIGRGGMGTVYVARDVKHARLIAIKVVSAEAVSGIGASQFLKEIRYTARMEHHHILPLHDSGEAAGFPFYVMPYIREGSLRDRLTQRGALPVDEVLRIADGVAQALAHAHAGQLLHCDVKPENVLLSHDHAYVADFGISRAIHAEVREWGRRGELDSSAGTPAYVSPEQASGEVNLDARSDVYSFGCMVFEMLSGVPPFTGTTTMEIVSKRFVEAPSLRAIAPHVSPPVAAVVQTAMSVNPDRRPGSVAAFIEALKEAATARPSPIRSVRNHVLRHVAGTVGRLPGFRPARTRNRFMDQLIQDLQFAVRSFKRRPLFTAIVLLTLGLGIGVNTAIFSVINAVLLRDLPFEAADELMSLGRMRSPDSPSLSSVSIAHFLEMRDQSESFDEIVAMSNDEVTITGIGEAFRARGARVNAGFFTDFLGVSPRTGRTFRPEDDVDGSEPVVVLNHELWRDRLEQDPAILGRAITLNGVPHTVIGITPPDFAPDFPILDYQDFWAPFRWNQDQRQNTGSNFLRVFGRLADGVTPEQARAELETIWHRISEGDPDRTEGWYFGTIFFKDELVRGSRNALLFVGAAAGLVLLIACVNVTNLMLAGAEARRREFAVRIALGAGQRRLLRQFMTESLTLAVAGGVLGTVAAYWGVRVLMASYGDAIPRTQEIGVSGTALLFALAASVVTGLAVGIVPALQSGRTDLHDTLKAGGRGGIGGSSRLREVLVVTEIALALMVVSGAGLLLRSFWEIQQVDTGVDARAVLTGNVNLPANRYGSDGQGHRFFDELVKEAATLPGVEAAGAINLRPFRGWNSNITTLRVIGEPDNTANFVEQRYVTPGYFETTGTPLIRGRAINDRDGQDGWSVVVINASLAEQLFSGREAIGTRLDPGWVPDGVEVVGIVEDVKEFGPDARTPPIMYYPLIESPDFAMLTMTIALRTRGNPATLTAGLRNLIQQHDPELPLYDVAVLEDVVSASLGDRKFQMLLLGTFGCLALVLGAVGIYGVMSYSVEQRTRELGVRVALGSSSPGIVRLVLSRAGLLAVLGIGLGMVGTLAGGRVIRSLLYDVTWYDPITLSGVVVVLGTVALLACVLPARRAARTDPMVALRAE